MSGTLANRFLGVELIDQPLLEGLLLLRVQRLSGQGGEAEEVLHPLTDGGDLGGMEGEAALLEHGTDTGQQARGIQGCQFQQGVAVFPLWGRKTTLVGTLNWRWRLDRGLLRSTSLPGS